MKDEDGVGGKETAAIFFCFICTNGNLLRCYPPTIQLRIGDTPPLVANMQILRLHVKSTYVYPCTLDFYRVGPHTYPDFRTVEVGKIFTCNARYQIAKQKMNSAKETHFEDKQW